MSNTTMIPRRELTGDETLQEVAVIISEGNPGALNCLCQLLKRPDGAILTLILDDMNIRGSQLYVAFADHCGGYLEKFAQCVFARDGEMVRTVNGQTQEGDWLAVQAGATATGRERVTR